MGSIQEQSTLPGHRSLGDSNTAAETRCRCTQGAGRHW